MLGCVDEAFFHAGGLSGLLTGDIDSLFSVQSFICRWNPERPLLHKEKKLNGLNDDMTSLAGLEAGALGSS